MRASARRDEQSLVVFGLLKPPATVESAKVELRTIDDRLQQSYPATNAGRQLLALSLRESTVGRSTRIILAMLAIVVGLVLVVACANVATVMPARASARREIAVRLALGATAAGVVGLIMSRSFRLIGVGVAFGLLGGWAIGLTMHTLLFGVSAADPLTYAAVLAVVSAGGFLATYLPAHRVASIDPAVVLKRE